MWAAAQIRAFLSSLAAALIAYLSAPLLAWAFKRDRESFEEVEEIS
jgi:hypothetical protein